MNILSPDLVGWSAALVLLTTISFQVFVQWRSGAVAGVSPWLFTGQLIASSGFLLYSALLQNWVFVATNAMVAVAALVGKHVDRVNRRRKAVEATICAAGIAPDRRSARPFNSDLCAQARCDHVSKRSNDRST
jgi:MtN3 and saliva related transmembrane protein